MEKYTDDTFFIDDFDIGLNDIPELYVDSNNGYCDAWVDVDAGECNFKEVSVPIFKVFNDERIFLGRLDITDFVNKGGSLFERMADNIFSKVIEEKLR